MALFDGSSWGSLRRLSGTLLSVLGGLIIFFSWVVANTRAQTYTQIKVAVESAQANFRLYTTLHELRDQQNSLAMEIANLRSSPGSNASRFAAGPLGDSRRNSLLRQYNQARMYGHQIKELMDFTVESASFSNAVGTRTSTHDGIDRLRREVERIYLPLSPMESIAETSLAGPDIDKSSFAVQHYDDQVRGAIPQVGPFYERITRLSNARQQEGNNELQDAKRQSQAAEETSLALYVIGSIMAIAGQVADKLLTKEDNPQDEAL